MSFGNPADGRHVDVEEPARPLHDGRHETIGGERRRVDRRGEREMDPRPDPFGEDHLAADLQELGQLLAVGRAPAELHERASDEARQQDAARDGQLEARRGDQPQHDLDAARPIAHGLPGARAGLRIGLDLRVRVDEKRPAPPDVPDRVPQGPPAPGVLLRRVDEELPGGREGPRKADVRDDDLEVLPGHGGHDGQRIVSARVVGGDEKGAFFGDPRSPPDDGFHTELGQEDSGGARKARRSGLAVGAGQDPGEAAGRQAEQGPEKATGRSRGRKPQRADDLVDDPFLEFADLRTAGCGGHGVRG
ncbi:MAG: hypothetical protein MZV70_70810 [Desulfobacterales bacterium]|nr:hypothetical protein [Desulfobacterales bacterium]